MTLDTCYVSTTGGAQFELPLNSRKTAGNGLHNDIVLGNPASDHWGILLECSGRDVTVTCLTGEIDCNENKLPPNARITTTNQLDCRAGDVEFTVGFPERATHESHSSNNPDSTILSRTGNNEITIENDLTAANTAPSNAIDDNNAPGIQSLSSRIPFTFNHVMFGVSALCVVIGTLSAIYAVTGSVFLANADTESGFSQFAAKLNEPEFKTLTHKVAEDGSTHIIEGTIDSRDQHTELLEAARKTGTKVKLNLKLNHELIETVEDIYRVNGVSAKAEVTAPGSLSVTTHTADLDQLELIGLLVKSDLPSITKLQVINTVPKSAPVKRPKYVPTPEKRITLISAGTNAYIMTEDNSRYFVGATLPSGHLVERIENGKVIVSKDGNQQTMTY
jgi:hypothetical protein